MAAYVIRARRAIVTLVAALSLLCGLLLVFKLGTREAIVRLPTHEIVAMLTLLVLPWVTVWAFGVEAKARATRADHPAPSVPEPIWLAQAIPFQTNAEEAPTGASQDLQLQGGGEDSGSASETYVVEHPADPRRTPSRRHIVERRATRESKA